MPAEPLDPVDDMRAALVSAMRALDLTLWSASNAHVFNSERALTDLAVSLLARQVLAGQSLDAARAETPALDALDGARMEYRECLEVRRLLGYLWTATGTDHLRPVSSLFAPDDPIRDDVERLAIFPKEQP